MTTSMLAQTSRTHNRQIKSEKARFKDKVVFLFCYLLLQKTKVKKMCLSGM